MSTSFSWSQGGLSPVPGSSLYQTDSLATSPAEKESGSWSDGNVSPLTTSSPQPTSIGSTSILSTSTTSDSQHSAGTEENHEKGHDGSDRHAPVGAIAGGTTAFIILLIGIALAIWIARRRRQRRQSRGKHPALSLSPSVEEDAIVSSQIEPFMAPESENLGQSFMDEKAEDLTPHGSSATRGFFEYAQQERVPIQHVANTPEPSSIQREMSEMRAEIERLRRVALRASFSGGESTDGHGVTTVPPPAYEE